MGRIVAFAPGRVNLIGDHTDYTGGLVLPMAIQLGTTVTLDTGGDHFRFTSADDPVAAELSLTVGEPEAVTPRWARYLAGVINAVGPLEGGTGHVSTTLPIGAGLSSSAALEVAVALALGFTGTPLDLARLCQHAEQQACAVPCGIMDQLASACGIEGSALLIDCESVRYRPVEIPDDCELIAVHSGHPRTLVGSAYAERRRACEQAAAIVGPLRKARMEDLSEIPDRTIAKRARHVISENARVADFAEAISDGDLKGAGELMSASHRSLRDDFEVSTPALDALVEQLAQRSDVYGARLTGAGFGGCVVALTTPGALQVGWRLIPSAGARLIEG